MTTHATNQPENRLHTILKIWQDNQWLYVIAGILIGLLIYPAVDWLFDDLVDFLRSLVPEAVGIGFTVFVIEVLNRRRDERNHIRDQKEQLIREAGSPIRDVAVSAVNAIQRRGWLYGKGINNHTDGILSHADLSEADLSGANLAYADLSYAKLDYSKLLGTLLYKTNLKGSSLLSCNLVGCSANSADFTQTNVSGADFSKSSLFSANFRGSILIGATFQDTDLTKVDLSFSLLEDSDFRRSDFSGAILRNCVIRGCDLRNIRMYTKFENMEVPRTTKLEGTYFTTGNMFSGSILPDGKIWELERTFDQFEAERRYLSFGHFNTTTNIYELTFEGGFKRRWKLGEGWLV